MNDEAEIIRRCRQGENGAFALLVERYQARALAVAAGMLRDREEARDAVQEAFVQAYTHLDRFDPERSFQPWLLGIVAKRSLDRLRKQRSFLSFFARYREEALFHDDPPADPGDETQRLLARLPEKQRQALWLSAVGGLSAGEIAGILGCSESTVRVHVFHARSRLKKEVDGGL